MLESILKTPLGDLFVASDEEFIYALSFIPGVIQKLEFGTAGVQDLDQALAGPEGGPVQHQVRCREVQRLECWQSQNQFSNHERYNKGRGMEKEGGRSRPVRLLEEELESYFKNKRGAFTVPYKMRGTFFQMDVWEALKEIPWGSTCSYSDIAQKIGKPKAVRAVGTAIGKNPFSILIPCHRVVGKGGLGGYAWGLERKQWLLEHEKKR